MTLPALLAIVARPAAARSRAASGLLCLALAVAGGDAAAQQVPPPVFVQLGSGESHLVAASVGLTAPWAWSRPLWSGQLGGYWEGSLGHWGVRGPGGRSTFTVLTVAPVLRYRPGAGRSPWFVEASIGLALMDRVYRTEAKRFSTAANFADTVGVGYTLGPQSEAGLRLLHVSNGAAKKPNPGENLLQLRYGFVF